MSTTTDVYLPTWRGYAFTLPVGAPKPTESEQATADLVSAALSRIGQHETGDLVAEFLTGQGITGDVGNSSRCPLARWLQKETGHDTIRVAHSVVAQFPLGKKVAVFDQTAAMRAFMREFDDGKYPHLVAPR